MIARENKVLILIRGLKENDEKGGELNFYKRE